MAVLGKKGLRKRDRQIDPVIRKRDGQIGQVDPVLVSTQRLSLDELVLARLGRKGLNHILILSEKSEDTPILYFDLV